MLRRPLICLWFCALVICVAPTWAEDLALPKIDGRKAADNLLDIVGGGINEEGVARRQFAQVKGAELQPAQAKKPVAAADGLSPQEAAAAMTVPDGFKVQLSAGEPLVHQPIAFTIDSRGRLWVAEAHTYPNRAKEGEGKDKIIILEDTDGDGTFEKRKVFIEGLNLISGLELGFGGVWVGAAPYLMFIPDKNGDDIPDGVVATNDADSARTNQTIAEEIGRVMKTLNFRAFDIEIIYADGVCKLVGNVDSEAQIRQALAMALSVREVKEVTSKLTASGKVLDKQPSPAWQFPKDVPLAQPSFLMASDGRILMRL